jgi:hypothetical protein
MSAKESEDARPTGYSGHVRPRTRVTSLGFATIGFGSLEKLRAQLRQLAGSIGSVVGELGKFLRIWEVFWPRR